MTKHEFCQLMAEGHRSAGNDLRDRAHNVMRARNFEHSDRLNSLADQEFARHRAFKTLADAFEEHENE